MCGTASGASLLWMAQSTGATLEASRTYTEADPAKGKRGFEHTLVRSAPVGF